MYVDSHNHVKTWSQDATQSLEELYRGYSQKDIYGIGLSDHYDIGNYTGDIEWIFDIGDYIATFSPYKRSLTEARREAEENDYFRPAFFLGIELGYLQDHIERLQKVASTPGLDYFILSIHEIYGKNPYDFFEEIFTRPQKQVYEQYLELCIQAVQAFPNASILGHYDFISRYAPQRESKMYYRHLADHFDSLFRAIIKEGTALEINTGTVRQFVKKELSLEDALPDPQLIRRYLDLGGELITLSADAHHVVHHGRYVKETISFLHQQGVRKLAYFHNHQAHTTPIQ